MGVVELEPAGGGLCDRDRDPHVGDGPAAAGAGDLQQLLLGGQDAGRGEPGCPVDVVDTGAVRATKLRRFGDRVRDAEPDRPGEGLVDDVVDCVLEMCQPDPGGAGLAFGLGPQVPDLPGGPRGLQGSDRRSGGTAEPGRVRPGALWLSTEDAAEHVVDLDRCTEDLVGLPAPGRPLLGLADRCVLGGAGLQRGLLCERDRFDRGGWSSVPGLELGGELAAADLDGASPA